MNVYRHPWSPCNPHNLSFGKEGGKVLRNYTGAGRACRVVIGAKMAALANDANSGWAGAGGMLSFKRLAHKNELAPPSTPPPPFLVNGLPHDQHYLYQEKRMAFSPICMSQDVGITVGDGWRRSAT